MNGDPGTESGMTAREKVMDPRLREDDLIPQMVAPQQVRGDWQKKSPRGAQAEFVLKIIDKCTWRCRNGVRHDTQRVKPSFRL